MSHTPGPWKVLPGDTRYVGVPGRVKPINALNAPDARLIAAAPDLLAALRAFVKTCDFMRPTGMTPSVFSDAEDAARAAIAKAEGR